MKKTVKKAVFGHFLKNFDKKLRFFGARSPSKLVYIGAKGAFRKILGSVGQKWISEKVTKGDPLGRQRGDLTKPKVFLRKTGMVDLFSNFSQY